MHCCYSLAKSLVGAVFIIAVHVAGMAVSPTPGGEQQRRAVRVDEPCFPLGTAQLSGTTPPSQSRDEWWCGPEVQYGFMGFSYPLEDDDCTDASNSYDQINADFARMKDQFGASMVRIYAPECRDQSIWRNLLLAGIQNNMAVLPQVWWGFGDQTLWQRSKAAILGVLNDVDLGPVAPYVFHSLAFGSEPIGDGVDGGPDGGFLADLAAMRDALQPYGVPVTISEDWDRPGVMSAGEVYGGGGGGLGPVGAEVAPLVDLLHVHIMPYYRPDLFPTADNVWPYFEQYIQFLQDNLPEKPILISQTLWSSEVGGTHDRGSGNPGEDLNDFTEYWETIEAQCAFFRDHQVGWFMHAYDDAFEEGLGLLDDDGMPKMSFLPPTC